MSNLPFTLDQLKILKTISEEGSFKKAAEKLYISQPAVSLQIQNLEKQITFVEWPEIIKKLKIKNSIDLIFQYNNNFTKRYLKINSKNKKITNEFK